MPSPPAATSAPPPAESPAALWAWRAGIEERYHGLYTGHLSAPGALTARARAQGMASGPQEGGPPLAPQTTLTLVLLCLLGLALLRTAHHSRRL